MVEQFDAVVVGAGINGMVAAAELAGGGLSVCLLDAGARIGGFVAADEAMFPGHVVDLFSSWHPQFVAGPAYPGLADDLHRHGLRYANAEGAVTATVGSRGAVVAHREVGVAAESLGTDGAAYRRELAALAADLDLIGGLLGGEPTWPRLGASALRVLRRRGPRCAEALVRQALGSGRSWTERTFVGDEVDRLWSPWLLHAGLAPDAAGGGLIAPLMAATIHQAGLPVVVGGVGRFLDAFTAVLLERGVTVRTGARVERIDPSRRTAWLTDGSTLRASRAILASTSVPALYEQLLPVDPRPESRRRFRPGRAAMQLHLGLDRPLRWSDERLAEVPLVHVSDGSSSVAVACAQARAGQLPARPTIVVGRQHVLDPSRVPEGAGALWVQLQEVPFRPVGDAAGELACAGEWTPQLAEAYADRVLRAIEEHAPGLGASVTGLRVITPPDLSAANLSCVEGDPYGGDLELDQFLRWRPPAGRRPAPGLWHIGAATHPGPGLGGGSGHLVAQAILRRRGR